MKRSLRSLFTVGFAGLALTACGTPLAGPDYPGEPLVTLSGIVTSEQTKPQSPTNVDLVWLVVSNGADYIVSESAPTEGSFPSNFSLSLYAPPEDSALNNTPFGRLGIAYIGVFDKERRRFIGADEDHLLVYLPEGVEAGSSISKVLDEGGGARAMPAGYHLIDVDRMTDAEIQKVIECQNAAPTWEEKQACGDYHDTLSLARKGEDTHLKVRLPDDPNELDLPNFN
jgi:hypothetical protein